MINIIIDNINNNNIDNNSRCSSQLVLLSSNRPAAQDQKSPCCREGTGV